MVNLSNGRVVASLAGHEEESSIEAVAFSHHLPHVAMSAGMDGRLMVWDLAAAVPGQRATCQHPDVSSHTGCSACLPLPMAACHACVCDAPGRAWAVAGAAVLASGWLRHITPPARPPALLTALQGVTRLAQHPTQPLVFTGCLDGAVRCWDTRTGSCVRQWRGHTDAVQDLAVSPDGNLVIAGGEDDTARVFSLLQD